MSEKIKYDENKVTIEEALNISGFGIYSYAHVLLSGLTIIGFACHAYSSTIIVPTSACELQTTSTQQGLIAAAPLIGLLLGAVPLSYLADKRGRKNMMIISIAVTTILNIIRAFSVNWIMLFIMEFLVNVIGSGQFMLAMTLLSECVPLAKRNLAVLLVTSIFLPAQGIMAVMAIPVIPLSFSHYLPSLGIYWNSWRTLQVLYSLPSLVAVVCLCFMTESPKFVFLKGDEAKALEIIRTLHRRNNGKSKEFHVTGLIKEVEKKTDEPLSTRDLFRMPLVKYLIIMSILLVLEQVGALQIWFPTIVNRFMQMVETGAPMNQTLCDVLRSRADAPVDPNLVPCSLNNTAMLIILASGTLQSVANLLLSTVVNLLGRRNIVVVLTAFCGLCGILVNLVPNTFASLVLSVLLLLGYIVVGPYTAMAVALFPTHVRAVAVALAVSGGRVATVGAIQLLNYLLVSNCDAGFYIFACLFAASAVVALFLPDDRRLGRQPLDHKKTDDDNTLS